MLSRFLRGGVWRINLVQPSRNYFAARKGHRADMAEADSRPVEVEASAATNQVCV